MSCASSTRVSKKKYGVKKLQYFANGATYQCNTLRHGTTYNLYLGVCKVSIQCIKGNVSYDQEMNDAFKCRLIV